MIDSNGFEIVGRDYNNQLEEEKMVKKKTFLIPAFRNSRKFIAILFIIAICSFCFNDAVFAFKKIHHRALTRVLKEHGFDDKRVSILEQANENVDNFEFLFSAAHCDNNMLTETSARLVNRIETIINFLKVCNPRFATVALGNALHTVQDIYAHTNAVDDGISVDILNMKTTDVKKINASCICTSPGGCTVTPNALVSGYFDPVGFVWGVVDSSHDECDGIGENMCCHLYLNKDADTDDVPNRLLFKPAMAAAEQATIDFIDKIREKLSEISPGNEDYYLNMLKKNQRKTIFVIDTTGSMGDDIAGVKNTVNNYIDQIVKSDEAPQLGLVTFKDSVADWLRTCDVEEFRAVINGLVASGGADCPEASNQAMLFALYVMIPNTLNNWTASGGDIIVATDASAGEPELGPKVLRYAKSRGIRINSILTDDCAGADYAMDNYGNKNSVNSYAAAKEEDPLTSSSARIQLAALANETGGTMFWVNRSEVDEVTETLMGMGEVDNTILFQNKADCETGKPVEFEIPVDTTLNEKITFMVTQPPLGTLSAVTLKRPGGEVVSPDDADASYLNLSSVKSYTIQNPAAGLWKLQIEGNGQLMARAYGNSRFTVNQVSFLKRVEPVYPGVDLIPIDGDPAAGSDLVLDIHLSGPPASLNVTLERQNGDLLQTLSLVESMEGYQDFHAEFTVPDETFVINISGKTKDGSDFNRTLPIAVTPQLVSVELDKKMVVIPAGGSSPVTFKIHNVSNESATYSATISSALDWPDISIPDFEIEANGSVEFEIDIPVPEYEDENVVNDIVFMVEDVKQTNVRNSAALIVTTALKDTGPCITVTNPTDGSTVSGTVTIETEVEDDKGIKGVDFYIDNVFMHTDNKEPYTYQWNTSTYAYGAHVIKAKTMDTSGQTAVDIITVNVDNPPTVSVTSPQSGALVYGTIDIQATATDDGGIAKVDFYIDGTLIGTDTTAPYTITWPTEVYLNGTHKIKVTATDASAQQASHEIDAIVQNIVLTLQAERLEEKAWMIKKYFGRIQLGVVNSGNAPVQKFVIYRKQDGNSYQPIMEITPSQLQNGAYTYLDKYLDKNASYSYKIVAYNSSGEEMGVSNEQTI